MVCGNGFETVNEMRGDTFGFPEPQWCPQGNFPGMLPDFNHAGLDVV